MNGLLYGDLRDLIGRRFVFARQGERSIPIKELKSAMWFQPDGTVEYTTAEEINKETAEGSTK